MSSCNRESSPPIPPASLHTSSINKDPKAAQSTSTLICMLLAAPGKSVAPVNCMLGAEVVDDAPTTAALESLEPTGGTGMAIVELAGTAALFELGFGLTGTGTISTVEAAVAMTVVLALVGPMMTTEGREAVWGEAVW